MSVYLSVFVRDTPVLCQRS